MLQLSEFVWMIHSTVRVVFNNFLLIDATDRSKISNDQKRSFFAVSHFHFSQQVPLSLKFTHRTVSKKDLFSLVPLGRGFIYRTKQNTVKP